MTFSCINTTICDKIVSYIKNLIYICLKPNSLNVLKLSELVAINQSVEYDNRPKSVTYSKLFLEALAFFFLVKSEKCSSPLIHSVCLRFNRITLKLQTSKIRQVYWLSNRRMMRGSPSYELLSSF